MAEPQLTDWFPGDVKPVHEGVYLRDYGIGIVMFSRFTGKRWFAGCATPTAAAAEWVPSCYQSRPWRGLAQDPSKEGV